MSKRKELRTKAVLPVKMTGVDSLGKAFSITSHTLDLTFDSARLGGVTPRLTQRQTVILQRFGVRAKFEVKWLGSGTRKGQCGLKALEPQKPLWGISLPQRQKDKFWVEPTPKDRRRFPRHACSGGADIFTALEYPFWAEIADISASGVYLKTFHPLPKGTLVRARVSSGDFRFETHAEVSTCDPAVGMGLRFTVMSPASLSELRDLLETLRVPFADAGELEEIIVQEELAEV
ncbi:MAG TPA: PilZ domain-containing protein [Terriglobales bacterium]|nr:PilZ domain-containing protein [Terriglobales bacterium]